MSRAWYLYVGAGNPLLPSSYVLSPGVPSCMTGSTICGINSPAGGFFPFGPFSPNLINYILSAMATGVPQPQTPPNAKRYVYLRIP